MNTKFQMLRLLKWNFMQSLAIQRKFYGQQVIRLFVLVSSCLLLQSFSGDQSFAQSVSGNDPKYNNNGASMNHLLLGIDLLAAGTPVDLYYARQNFDFIINMNEGQDGGLKPKAYLNLGVIDSLEGKLDSAVKHFVAAIQLDPNYSEAYFNLGGAFYKLGDLKKSEQAFLKAIELQPEYGRAHYSLGFLYFDQKKYDLARMHADKALQYGIRFGTLKDKLSKIGR
jgi:tetratricopeptide (TPR) repeat protein